MKSVFASARIRLQLCTTKMRMATLGVILFTVLLMIRFSSESVLLSHLHSSLSSSSNTIDNKELPRERYDESKLELGSNYPVCEKLDDLFMDLMHEEQTKDSFEDNFGNLYNRNELYCGRQRNYGPLWIFGKKHYERLSEESCVPRILQAKRKMLTWLGDQCAVQAKYNEIFKWQQKKGNDGISSGNQNVPHISVTKPNSRTRGVIYTGLPSEHFQDIYQSILAHRNLKVSIPVEVWVNTSDMDVCQEVFESPGAFEFLFPHQKPLSKQETHDTIGKTTCKELPATARGFASKFHALLGTHFTDVLFMDADNIAVRDVNEIFDSKQYQQTGSILWPDLWGESCRNTEARKDNGYTGFRTNVIWQAKIGGLTWKNTRDYAHESEAGQIAFDLTRHGGLLDLGRHFIEEGGLLRDAVNGDKDIFRLLHLMMDEPFTFIEVFPGYSTINPGGGRDCLTHYFGTGGEVGETNWIDNDKSGAFYVNGELKQDESNADHQSEEDKEGKEKQDVNPTWSFKFGSLIGSVFGSGSETNPNIDCSTKSGACGGVFKEQDGLVLHDGELIPLHSIEDPEIRRQYTNKNTPKALNRLGNPAGTGYNAPVGTDPMFFHQLKMREPRAFRFAYRAKNKEEASSICFDFSATEESLKSQQEQIVEKFPSADKLFIFAQKLFLQVDWKWQIDGSNTWSRSVWLNSWSRAISERCGVFVELFMITVLLIGVVMLVFLRKFMSGPKSL